MTSTPKLLCSVSSKISGLNTMEIFFGNRENDYSFHCEYSDFDSSYYAKSFTIDEIKGLIDFLVETLQLKDEDNDNEQSDVG